MLTHVFYGKTLEDAKHVFSAHMRTDYRGARSALSRAPKWHEADGGRIVPVVLLQGRDDNVRLLYRAPARSARVSVRVEATRAVDVYALPEQALGDFDEGRAFYAYRASKNHPDHRLNFVPEPREHWYLVIESRSGQPTSAFYEVIW